MSVWQIKAAQDDAAVQEVVAKVEDALGEMGRIFVKESGAEPVVRVMVGTPDHDTCQKHVGEVVDVIYSVSAIRILKGTVDADLFLFANWRN